MKRMSLLVVLIINLFFVSKLTPQNPPDTCLMPIGMNLAGSSDWGGEWPFVNIMKYCRTWISQNVVWYGGGQNMWDTDLQDIFEYDENGYPLKVPVFVNHPNADTSQMLLTVWANTGSLPEGIYIILYEGEGAIGVWGDAQKISEIPGRIEVLVTHGNQIMALQILESVEGNHIRNIRFLLPGTEDTYQQNPWCQQWIEKLGPFQSLRFMDWGHTNNSHLKYWSDRPHQGDYSYTIQGMPYEWMIRICNMKNADAWVCIPHLANDEYIQNLATLFRDSLEPGRKIYVEYSNELWNWMFDQAHYCLDSLNQSLPWPERIGPKLESVFDIWDSVFDGQDARLIKVVGAQLYWDDIVDRILDYITPGKSDALTGAAYIGLNNDSLSFYGENLTVDKIFELADFELENDFYNHLLAHRQIAGNHGLNMVYYEGGQHFTPNPFGSTQPYNDSLVAAQTDKRMYDLYDRLLDTLRSVATEPLVFMNFSFISPFSGRYGSWGVLQSQFSQNPPYLGVPKYQALLDNMFNCDLPTTQIVNLPAGWSGISSFVDPSNSDLEQLLAPIWNELIILSANEGSFIPGSQTNTIENWYPGLGYKIKLNSDVQIGFSGTVVQDKTIQLTQGWNLIPVLSELPVQAAGIGQQIEGRLIVIMEVAGINLYWPGAGVYTLETLLPGKAYFIKVSEDVPLTFSEN